MEPMTVQDAERLGYEIDKACYPWIAYLGPRFAPTSCWQIQTPAWPALPPRPIDANVDPVGRAHPETARATGKKMAPRMGTMRRQVYDWIRSRGQYGATADEVGAHFGWGHQSASAAVSTLKSDGWIGVVFADTLGRPRTRPTRSGNPAEVMVVIRGTGE